MKIPIKNFLAFVSIFLTIEISDANPVFLLPKNTSFLIKFDSIYEGVSNLSNLVYIWSGPNFEANFESLRLYLKDLLGVDVFDISNVQEVGIDPGKAFALGFNTKGQPFFVLPLKNTNTERLINIFLKNKFVSNIIISNYLVSTGEYFEREGNFDTKAENFNMFLSGEFFESVLDITLPKEYKMDYFLKFNTTSNTITIDVKSPLVFSNTNANSLYKHYTYVPEINNISFLVNFKQGPFEVISNISTLQMYSDLGLLSPISNFERIFNIKVLETGIQDLLTGDTLLGIYSYNHGENNSVVFMCSTKNQKKLSEILSKYVREIAKTKTVFRFSVFDKEFYRLPVTENYSVYLGVIFNRFIVSSDKDVLITLIRNISKEIQEITTDYRQKLDSNFFTVIVNSQSLLDKTLKIENVENWAINILLPFLIKSKNVILSVNPNQNKLSSEVVLYY